MRKSAQSGQVGRLRAVGYVRVCTDKQAQEGVSLESQQVRIRAHCVSQDIDLIDLVIDEEASAKSLDRLFAIQRRWTKDAFAVSG